MEREIVNTVGKRASNGYNLSCFDNNSFGGVVLDCILGRAIFMVSIDGDLDSDGATTDFLALEGVDGLLLFFLVTNVDKAVTLAPSGLPPPSNNASGDDLQASISEKSGQPVVVDVEAKVCNEEHILGWLTDGILTSGTRGTMEPRPATEPRFVGRIFCTIGFRSVSGRSGGLSFGRLGPVAALIIGSEEASDVAEVTKLTLDFFFFFLGFSASSVAGASPGAVSALSVISPFASASVTSPGTDLGPRLPPVNLLLLLLYL
jgi:hypothetical protein